MGKVFQSVFDKIVIVDNEDEPEIKRSGKAKAKEIPEQEKKTTAVKKVLVDVQLILIVFD